MFFDNTSSKEMSPELQKQYFQDLLLCFPPVKEFLIDCRFLLCKQTYQEVNIITGLIKQDVTTGLISEYEAHLNKDKAPEECICFSDVFVRAFQETLINIINHTNFRNDRVIALFKDLIENQHASHSCYTILFELMMVKTRIRTKAYLKGYLSDADTNKRFHGAWNEVIDYTNRQYSIFKPNKNILITGEMINAMLYLSEYASFLFALSVGIMLVIYPLAIYFVMMVLTSTILPQSPEVQQNIMNIKEDLLKLNKIAWHRKIFTSKKHQTAFPEVEVQALEENALSSESGFSSVDLFSDQHVMFSPSPKKVSRGNKRPMKQKKQNIKIKPVETNKIITFPGTEYFYNPDDSEASTAFPMGGSLANDLFYISIHSEVKDDILNKNDESFANEIYVKFLQKVAAQVKFSDYGENLRSIGRIIDPATEKSHICYELRVLGERFGDHRLLGAIRPTDPDKSGKQRCLIELNTYSNGAHKGNHLARSVEEVKSKIAHKH